MQKSFQFKLTGGAWFGLFIALYFITIALVALCVGLFVNLTTGTPVYPVSGVSVAIACVVFVFYILFVLGWIIPVYRKWIGLVEFDGEPFKFHGKIWEFIGLNLLGLFLSVITLFIYFPWYLKKLMKYLAENVEYKGARLNFNGDAGRIFVTFLWAFYLPMIVLIAFNALLNPQDPGNTAGSIVYQFLSQVLFIPFSYKLYQWFFNNLSYQSKVTHWNTSFWSSVGMVLGQILLMFITIFIYFPAAMLRIYRYFAARTEVMENGQVKGHFEFQGKIGKGFLLIWGQVLLSIITLMIYLPWAVAKIYKWILEETKYISA